MCIGLNCEPWIRGGGGEEGKEQRKEEREGNWDI